MKVNLLYKNKDFDPKQPFPKNVEDLSQDLELNTLFKSMANGDDFLFDTSRNVFLNSLMDQEEIRYRQDVLKDCLKNQEVVRDIYRLTIESIENKRRDWLGFFSNYPDGILSGSIRMMAMFFKLLRRLRKITDTYADNFESEGFINFFMMIKSELTDEYFDLVDDHLKNLEFREGVLISVKLGVGNEGTDYILRLPRNNKNWFKKIFSKRSSVYSIYVDGRDEAGTRTLANLRDRGINLVANALAQSADHIDSFLMNLRTELAFYLGCMNLHNQLKELDYAAAFPLLENENKRALSFVGLYDICLALTAKQKVVGNTIDADQKNLVIITGANQGGKSTFLRSIGLAQLMLQSGMFVPAEKFHANLCRGIFTHYKRKEDASMKSGKLDEELSRMSEIVDLITPNCLMLFNESFTATNEREGSEIARQITNALIERHVKVFFVTHMYEFAHTFYERQLKDAMFLQAERKAGGKRTFKLTEGEPSQTSYGEDVYKEVFLDVAEN